MKRLKFLLSLCVLGAILPWNTLQALEEDVANIKAYNEYTIGDGLLAELKIQGTVFVTAVEKDGSDLRVYIQDQSDAMCFSVASTYVESVAFSVGQNLTNTIVNKWSRDGDFDPNSGAMVYTITHQYRKWEMPDTNTKASYTLEPKIVVPNALSGESSKLIKFKELKFAASYAGQNFAAATSYTLEDEEGNSYENALYIMDGSELVGKAINTTEAMDIVGVCRNVDGNAAIAPRLEADLSTTSGAEAPQMTSLKDLAEALLANNEVGEVSYRFTAEAIITMIDKKESDVEGKKNIDVYVQDASGNAAVLRYISLDEFEGKIGEAIPACDMTLKTIKGEWEVIENTMIFAEAKTIETTVVIEPVEVEKLEDISTTMNHANKLVKVKKAKILADDQYSIYENKTIFEESCSYSVKNATGKCSLVIGFKNSIKGETIPEEEVDVVGIVKSLAIAPRTINDITKAVDENAAKDVQGIKAFNDACSKLKKAAHFKILGSAIITMVNKNEYEEIDIYIQDDEAATVLRYSGEDPLDESVAIGMEVKDIEVSVEVNPAMNFNHVMSLSGVATEKEIEAKPLTVYDIRYAAEEYPNMLVRTKEKVKITADVSFSSYSDMSVFETGSYYNLDDDEDKLDAMVIAFETDVKGSKIPSVPVYVTGIIAKVGGAYVLVPRTMSDFAENLDVESLFGGETSFAAWSKSGVLYVSSSSAGVLEVISVDGRLVRRIDMASGASLGLALERGIYILKMGAELKKVVIE